MNLTKLQETRLQKLKDHLFKIEEEKLLKKIKRVKRKILWKVAMCKIRLPLYILLENKCKKKRITKNKFLGRLLKKELQGGLKNDNRRI